jgi:hypothetical protein
MSLSPGTRRSFLINLDTRMEGQRMITLVTHWPSLLKQR